MTNSTTTPLILLGVQSEEFNIKVSSKVTLFPGALVRPSVGQTMDEYLISKNITYLSTTLQREGVDDIIFIVFTSQTSLYFMHIFFESGR